VAFETVESRRTRGIEQARFECGLRVAQHRRGQRTRIAGKIDRKIHSG
jgi:hypothetical protein